MKNIKYHIGALLTLVFALTSCSPDSFEGADPAGIPTVEGIEPVIVVDDVLNQVTFSLPADAKAVMPVWIFTENKGTDKERVTYSTVNGLQRIFAKAGDYDVEMKLMNRNGVSDGSIKKTFHIQNTIMDFSKYITLIAGGTSESTKEWRVNNEVAGHFGCGPSGTTGTEWWSAGVDEKAGIGMYDNRLTFGSDYAYTFNPGETGIMYVNNGVTGYWPAYENSEDYTVPMAVTESSYEFEVDGDDLYLVLPSKTPFVYVPYADSWENPRFRIESISGSEMHLISDNGDIAWHYTLTSGKAAVKFSGFKYDSEFNLWRPFDATEPGTHFYYAPGWAQIADPGYAHDGSSYTFTLPEATSDQWQAQCPIKPEGLRLSADKKYDFSVIINSSTDIKGVTVKLTDINSGDNYVFAERVDVTAYEDCIFYLSDVNNLTADAECELFFDFGGNPANTVVTVRNIVVKDHDNDDGTVLPADEPDNAPSSVEWREDDNLLANMAQNLTYYYAPGWSQLPDPATAIDGDSYTLTLPEATSDQWQCQFTFNDLGVALSSEKKYDFRVILSATNPVNGVTVKLTQQDDDNTYLTADRHDITEAYTDQVVELVGLAGQDITNLKIVFDFGGNPAATDITVKGMLLQEHQASADELTWDAEAADNLWGASLYPNAFYYAPGWSQIDNPAIQENGRKYTISLPTATSDQWQAQVTTETEIATSADKKYDFQVLLTSNVDMNGVTVKLTKVGDDNVYFTADRHDLTAYETKAVRFAGMAGQDIDKIKLVLDFGGNPDGAEVEVSDIILREHQQ